MSNGTKLFASVRDWFQQKPKTAAPVLPEVPAHSAEPVSLPELRADHCSYCGLSEHEGATLRRLATGYRICETCDVLTKRPIIECSASLEAEQTPAREA